ncbi:Pentatricopeptide repeat-containing protein, chloroplastic, partial [Cucurbita argyrosperma subsp. sororia]
MWNFHWLLSQSILRCSLTVRHLSLINFHFSQIFTISVFAVDFFSDDWRLSSDAGKCRVKPKDLVLGNTSRQIWCKPNEYIYAIVISLLGCEGLLNCSEIFDEMSSQGVIRSVFSYTALINAYGRNGAARGLGDEAEMFIVLTFEKLGSVKEAMDVFKQMQAAGCVPNSSTYSILLNLYGKHGRYDDVRELFLEMKESSAEPDATTYNILIRVFGEGGYYKEAVALFHDFLDEKIDPNIETYKGGGLYMEFEAIWLRMRESGISRNLNSFSGIVEGFVDESKEQFHEIKAS